MGIFLLGHVLSIEKRGRRKRKKREKMERKEKMKILNIDSRLDRDGHYIPKRK